MDVALIWPKTMRLMCDFNEVFDNDIKIITQEELLNLDDVDNYHGSAGGLSASQHEFNLNGYDNLLKLSQKYKPKSISQLNISNLPKKNTIIFYNNFIGSIDKETVVENFNRLKPKKWVNDKISNTLKELDINKNVIGIHGRATDFTNERIELISKRRYIGRITVDDLIDDITKEKEISEKKGYRDLELDISEDTGIIDFYLWGDRDLTEEEVDLDERIEKYYGIIDKELKNNKEQKFFFCSDDPSWEERLSKKYPNNVITRKIKNSVYKANPNKPYNNNVMTPVEAIIDGYIDIVLLSKTNFKYYNNLSTFGTMINALQNG